jgi:hypothetical protein
MIASMRVFRYIARPMSVVYICNGNE